MAQFSYQMDNFQKKGQKSLNIGYRDHDGWTFFIAEYRTKYRVYKLISGFFIVSVNPVKGYIDRYVVHRDPYLKQCEPLFSFFLIQILSQTSHVAAILLDYYNLISNLSSVI